MIPNIWENKSHVPNHQPVVIIHPKTWYSLNLMDTPGLLWTKAQAHIAGHIRVADVRAALRLGAHHGRGRSAAAAAGEGNQLLSHCEGSVVSVEWIQSMASGRTCFGLTLCKKTTWRLSECSFMILSLYFTAWYAYNICTSLWHRIVIWI